LREWTSSVFSQDNPQPTTCPQYLWKTNVSISLLATTFRYLRTHC